MEFLKKIKWTPLNVLKGAGLVLAAVIVLSVVFRLAAPIIEPVVRFTNTKLGISSQRTAPAYDASEGAYYGKGGGAAPTLSLENIGVPVPQPGGTTGDNAEEFEVTDYSASIETRDRDATCAEVTKLKTLEYVIFESASEYDKGCSYTFKVKHDNVEEILNVVKALKPKDVTKSTYTIKQQIEDFTSEMDILKKKLASINETMENAMNAYDEITVLATRTEDAESLAKIIDSKIGIIERLTQERINVTAQLERLKRAKLEQLDRLDYTYFHVSVYENKFIDGDDIKDSWKAAVRSLIQDANRTIQNVTVNLLPFLLTVAQYVLYFFILLLVVKYLWKAAKHIWRK